MIGVAAIKIRCIDRVIYQLRLCFVFAMHAGQAAFFFQPLADQTDDVNAPGVRRVVKRFVLDVRAIVEHRVQPFGNLLQKIVAHDDERDAAWPHVLLRAGIDDPVFLNRNRLRQNVGRSVGNQRHVANLGFLFPLDAFDCFVGSYVDVSGAADPTSTLHLPGTRVKPPSAMFAATLTSPARFASFSAFFPQLPVMT